MKKVISIVSKAPTTFIVDWMLNDTCTYDCTYCPSGNKAGKEKWLTLELAKGFLDSLENQLSPGQSVEVLMTGGEPTIWPKFVDLCSYIKDKGWKVSVITNLVRSLDWWKTYWNLFSTVTYSYHSETTNDEEFVKKITWLDQNANNSQAVKVMMNPNEFDRCRQVFEKLSITDMPIVASPVQQTFGLEQINIPNYTEEQASWFSVNKYIPTSKDLESLFLRKQSVYDDGTVEDCNPNKIIVDKQNTFYGWDCDAGLENVFVDSAGNIYGATCKQGNLLGSIQQVDSIKWPTSPVVCKALICPCFTDIRISKRSRIFNT
jgi:organic radical activating enzyme